jgi:sugar-phosphatase
LFLNVSDELKIPPQNCLVIEDAPAGIEAAIRANMTVVAITNSRPASDLLDANLIIKEFSSAALQQVETKFLA